MTKDTQETQGESRPSRGEKGSCSSPELAGFDGQLPGAEPCGRDGSDRIAAPGSRNARLAEQTLLARLKLDRIGGPRSIEALNDEKIDRIESLLMQVAEAVLLKGEGRS